MSEIIPEKFINFFKVDKTILLGFFYLLFVSIVLNGVLEEKKNQILRIAQNDISKTKFFKVLFEYLWFNPIILIIYFFILLFLLFIIQFTLILLLDTNSCAELAQPPPPPQSPFKYLKDSIPILFKTICILFILNIILILFISLFMIIGKKKENNDEHNINNTYIKNVLDFYYYGFLILAFISYKYISIYTNKQQS